MCEWGKGGYSGWILNRYIAFMLYDIGMSIIEELKDERIRRGLTQRAIAEAMGTTQSALSRAERNGNPTQDFLERYRSALQQGASNDSPLELTTVRFIVGKIAREYGLAEVWLYGSVARGDARPDSDVDLLYRLKPGERLGLTQTQTLTDELSSYLGREVSLMALDTVERRAERSAAGRLFYERIKPDLIKVA